MDQKLEQAIQERLDNGLLPCNQAFAIAQILHIEPLTVGLAANDLDIRICRCQLGLFGYGPKAEGKHKIVHAMDNVPGRLAARLRSASTDGAISCAEIWKVADGLGFKRIEASSAVEAMGLKVSRCQLGCFPHPWPGTGEAEG